MYFNTNQIGGDKDNDSYYYPTRVFQDCFPNESSAQVDKYQATKIKPALYKTCKVSKYTSGRPSVAGRDGSGLWQQGQQWPVVPWPGLRMRGSQTDSQRAQWPSS